MLSAAVGGLSSSWSGKATEGGAGGADEGSNLEDSSDVIDFGFDSQAALERHVGEGSTAPTPTRGQRRGTMADSVARRVASLSQLFIAEHATAAMTAGTYAGRAGSVSLGVPSRDDGDEDFVIPASAAPIVAPPALPAAAAPTLPEAISEESDTAQGDDSEQV